jgi:hypothetical protein
MRVHSFCAQWTVAHSDSCGFGEGYHLQDERTRRQALPEIAFTASGQYLTHITCPAAGSMCTSYLGSGRAIGYTRVICRGETCEIVAELRLGEDRE